MSDNGKIVYKFHIKIDAGMKQKLENQTMSGKKYSINMLVRKIIALFSPVMEKKHLDGVQQYSRYGFVCDNMDIQRESLFVYLSENQYRQLKLLHQDLNFYSMAQLLRLILREFLDMVRVYGDAVETKLLELYLKWKRERELLKQRTIPIEELLHFISQNLRKPGF